jgi:S1-C subfamily serine protease
LAGAAGEDISKIKDFLQNNMTREDVLEAQRRAKEFQATLEQKNNSRPTSETTEGLTEKGLEIQGTGSGFIVGRNGLIITAWHVIEGADKIAVEYQGELYPAECVTGDKNLDIAVLRVKHEFVTCLKIVSSESATVSEKVFTVGFPNVEIQGTEPKYTEGVINAKSGVGGLVKYFQISVPIQPGNSGGALVNAKGEVVGMVTAKLNELYTLDKTGSIPQNVNYALKSSFILPYLENFRKEIKQAENKSDEASTNVVKQAIDAAVLIVSYQQK